MKRFKNIAVLLGETGDDERILKRAGELAERNAAVVSVYAVMDRAAYVPDMDTVLYPPGEVLRQVKDAKRQRLKRAMERLRREDVRVLGKLLKGKPFVRIIQEVLKNEHDLLMLPANREGRAPSLFLGGTPMHLLRKCPCAVWVFRPRRKRRFGRIMAAVNVATRRREEVELNIKIMSLAASLARQEEAELHVVSCWTVFAELLLTAAGGLSGEERRRYVHDSRNQYLRLLNTFLDAFSFDESRLRIHLPKGEAGVLIPGVAARERIDLLVMGTVARSGIPGLLIGNTAERVLNSLPCSVLAVKPDGFVSPIQPNRP